MTSQGNEEVTVEHWHTRWQRLKEARQNGQQLSEQDETFLNQRQRMARRHGNYYAYGRTFVDRRTR